MSRAISEKFEPAENEVCFEKQKNSAFHRTDSRWQRFSALVETCDVAVVGGGPAGLAASTRLRALGVGRVVLLEREEEAGGVPRHCGHSPYGLREFRRLMTGRTYARVLVRDARAAGVDLRLRHGVVDCAPGPDPTLTLSTPNGVRQLTAARIVLATGIREQTRAARLIGGMRPQGIVTTGALQSMVYLKGMVPFTRPVVLGTEIVSFSCLLTCRHAGARPVAMVEAQSRITARAIARGLPFVMGVPVYRSTKIIAVHGERRVQGLTLQPSGGRAFDLSCDGLVTTGGFTPETALVRRAGWAMDPGTNGPSVDQFGRLEDPHYFAAGNLLRPVETAGWCWQEGRNAAEAVYRDLSEGLPPADRVMPIRIEGTALRYVVAQRLCPTGVPASGVLQLRARRPVRGKLTIFSNGLELLSKSVSTMPERRLTMPLSSIMDRLPSPPDGRTLRVYIREDS